MRLLPRRGANDEEPAVTVDPVEPPSRESAKGRPTPKRRDAGPRRGPATPAPQTRGEARARNRERSKAERATAPKMTPAERRARMLSGDPAHLAKRDAGAVRALARDWVDTHHMVSNFLLLLFPLIVVSYKVKALSYVILALFVVVLIEWIITGRKIMALAKSRGIDPGRETAMGVGLYSGTRAYLPARWRVPRPRVKRGDTI